MFRKRIQSICTGRNHMFFPVVMKYGGRRWWNGLLVHVMYCPVCGQQRLYVYQGFQIRRVA